MIQGLGEGVGWRGTWHYNISHYQHYFDSMDINSAQLFAGYSQQTEQVNTLFRGLITVHPASAWTLP